MQSSGNEQPGAAPEGAVVSAAGSTSCVDSGTGAPAVVFIGGTGGLAITWEPVRRQVARSTRALAYDRPGYGGSARRQGPDLASPRALADELGPFLDAAQVPRPVVLVAHAFGGFVARAFAATHPDDVAGLVLVDASHEDEWTDRYPEAHRRGLAVAARSLAALARNSSWGLPQLLGLLPFVPLGAVDRLPEPYRTRARRLGTRRGSLRTAATEFAHLREAAAEMEGLGGLGSIPLVVVTHGAPGPVPPGVSPEQAAELERCIQDSAHRLAQLSTRGLVTTAASGHDVHIDAPDTVARAVLDLLAEVRD